MFTNDMQPAPRSHENPVSMLQIMDFQGQAAPPFPATGLAMPTQASHHAL